MQVQIQQSAWHAFNEPDESHSAVSDDITDCQVVASEHSFKWFVDIEQAGREQEVIPFLSRKVGERWMEALQMRLKLEPIDLAPERRRGLTSGPDARQIRALNCEIECRLRRRPCTLGQSREYRCW